MFDCINQGSSTVPEPSKAKAVFTHELTITNTVIFPNRIEFLALLILFTSSPPNLIIEPIFAKTHGQK
jgi:hypothetical protein